MSPRMKRRNTGRSYQLPQQQQQQQQPSYPPPPPSPPISPLPPPTATPFLPPPTAISLLSPLYPASPYDEERLLHDDENPYLTRELSSSSSTVIGDYYMDDVFESKLMGWGSSPISWDERFFAWCRSRPRHIRRIIYRFLSSWRAASLIKWVCLFVIAFLALTPIFAPSYSRLPAHYSALEARCQGPHAPSGCANLFNEQVYISVSLYDKGGHLALGHWGENLLQLINLIGEKNVFLSIYENDSGADGEAALEVLRHRLRCRYSIVNDPHVPLDQFQNYTLTMPDGTERLKRLAYLSEIRNRALRPIDAFDPEFGIVEYDRILFMNDVVFRPMEAAHLLFSTNVGSDGRAHYLSTCAMDYASPFRFYDLYAMRDAEGFSNGLPIFPIFSNSGEGISRAAMLAGSDAVPVSACWGGMVAMDAKYVQHHEKTLPDPGFQDIGHHIIDPKHPRPVTAPVRFRYEPEVFVDACECCLFLADVTQVARKQGAKELGVYVNPYVRVTYSYSTLSWIPMAKRWERLLSIPHRIISPMANLPTFNPHREVREGQPFMEEIWVGEGKNGHWQMVPRVGRSAMFCNVREMQALLLSERTSDVNWEDMEIPGGQALYFPS